MVRVLPIVIGIRINENQQRMNSSRAELRLVKPRVESSNLSSSAIPFHFVEAGRVK
jgi:hypothetical protein